MRDIVEEGINVVDLSDNEKLYNIEVLRADTNAYMRMLVRFERAHEESKLKSERIKEAWRAKRELAKLGERKMTVWCPAWLRLSEDRDRYELIDEKAAVVRRIFNEAANGRGIYAIAKRLNQQNVKTFGKSRGWHPSYIIKLLKNRAAIGTYEPTRVGGSPANEQQSAEHRVEEYFPAAVDAGLFYRVQDAIAGRKLTGRGRKGSRYTNLFTGVKISCAYCNGRMKFENKGSGPKGGYYFVCDDFRRGLQCVALRWEYEHFENSVVSFLYKELDFSALRGDKQDDQVKFLNQSIQSLRGEVETLKIQRLKRIDLIDTTSAEVVAPLVNELSLKIKGAEARIIELTKQLGSLKEDPITRGDGLTNLRQLIASMKDQSSDQYGIRTQLAFLLRGFISEIYIGSRRGSPPMDGEYIDFNPMKWTKNEREHLDASILLARIQSKTDSDRYYVVRFKNDRFQIDVPPVDPMNHPLSDDRELAIVYWMDDDTIEIVETDSYEADIQESEQDPNSPRVLAMGWIETSLRSGAIRRGD